MPCKRTGSGNGPHQGASVAQLAEQLTLNQLVLGSSPSRGTSFQWENEGQGFDPKDSPNIQSHLGDESDQNVKLPIVPDDFVLRMAVVRDSASKLGDRLGQTFRDACFHHRLGN
jgi:hypothetical protein